MDRIRLFIDELSTEESTPELANVYSPDIPQSDCLVQLKSISYSLFFIIIYFSFCHYFAAEKQIF